jgi:hypothetical protein
VHFLKNAKTYSVRTVLGNIFQNKKLVGTKIFLFLGKRRYFRRMQMHGRWKNKMSQTL